MISIHNASRDDATRGASTLRDATRSDATHTDVVRSAQAAADTGDDLPSLGHRYLPRGRLDEKLSRLRPGGPQVLGLWAAAGTGKTSLMSHWARQLQLEGEQVFWYSGATGSADTQLLRAQTRSAQADPSTDSSTAPSTAEIANNPEDRPVYVFVDDVHLIRVPLGRRQVEQVLSVTRPNLRLILAGRWEPVTGQAYLGSAGGIVEIRGDELAFTSTEAVALAALHEVSLATDAAGVLVARTGGWATGLALAMPWLYSSAQPERAVSQFDGDNRAVADYLVSEIIENLSETDRDVLMSSAVRPVVPLDLAAILSGRNDVGSVLRRLSRRNTLITEEAGELAYRYHPILLAFMQAEAWRRDSAAAAAAHERAAQWYSARGDGVNALEQSLLSRQPELVSIALDRFAVELVAIGRSALVVRALRLLKGLPETFSSLVVRLLLEAPYFADTRLAGNIGAAVRARLALLPQVDASKDPESSHDAESSHWVALFIILQAFRAGDPDGPGAHLVRLQSASLAAIRQADLAIDLLAATATGWCLSLLQRLPEAEVLLTEVSQAARGAGYEWLFLLATDLAATAAARNGHWMLANSLEAQIADIAASSSSPTDRRSARATLMLLIRQYEQGEPVSMSVLEKLSNPDGAAADFGVMMPATTLMLQVYLDEGTNIRVNLDRLSRLMAETAAVHPRSLSASCVLLFDLTSSLDGRSEARGVVRLVEQVLGDDSLEAELLRFLSAPRVRAHEPSEVALEVALAQSRYSWRSSTVVSAWLALAQVAETTGRRADSDARLITALRIGEELGLERPFLNFDGEGAALVRSRLGRLGAFDEFGARVVSRMQQGASEVGFDGFGTGRGLLTRREHELLRELPLHQTVIEIAAKQSVSANTAKTHLRSIYSKLGASDRAQAVAIARERGLL